MKTFLTTIRIPFHFVDAAGVVFYARVFELAHATYEEFIVSLGIEWSQWFANREWAVPLRHAEADYHRPLFANQTCQVNLTLLRLSDSSFEVACRFLRDDILHAEVRTVHTFINIKTKSKAPLPHDIRAKFLPYLNLTNSEQNPA